MENYYLDYFERLNETLSKLKISELEKLEEIIFNAYKDNKTIFVIGNGGSASAATHWACDFSKGTKVEGKKPLRCISLTDNIAIMTAISNDISYEDVFVEQLKVFLSSGDILIGISASGNSENIVKALQYCKDNGGIAVAIVGFTGGKCREIANHTIYIPNNEYGIVEDIHIIIDHMISQKIKKRIEDEA